MSYRNAPLSGTGRLPPGSLRRRGRWSLRRTAERFQVAVTTAARWAGRYRERNADVLSKAGWTPFDGRTMTGRVVQTYLRGTLVAKEGRPLNACTGAFVPGLGWPNARPPA